MFTKRISKLQFLPIIWKTSSVTYPFYYIFGKLPKFFNFSGGMAKSYSVELISYIEKVVFWITKKFHRITSLQKFLFELAHLMLYACKKSGWVTEQNFEIKTNVLCTFYFRFKRFYAVFHFRYFAQATFTRNFDSHSWRVHFRHVVSRLSARARLKILSSFLISHIYFFLCAWEGKMNQILQSDWFRERAEFFDLDRGQRNGNNKKFVMGF